jgi:C-terminal processing protease CtpA/Prc
VLGLELVSHSDSACSHLSLSPFLHKAAYDGSLVTHVVELETDKTLGGSIGILLARRQSSIAVDFIFENSSAFRSGKLRPGDVILAINNVSVVGVAWEVAQATLRRAMLAG